MHGGVISMQHWGCELRSCAGSGGAKPGWKMSKHLIRIIIPKRFFLFLGSLITTYNDAVIPLKGLWIVSSVNPARTA